MIAKQAQPTLRKPLRRDLGHSELDPARLSAKLRELALRAHQLVRATDGTGSSPVADKREQELVDVLAEIVSLQRHLGSHHMDTLATYVSALRERVEECVA